MGGPLSRPQRATAVSFRLKRGYSSTQCPLLRSAAAPAEARCITADEVADVFADVLATERQRLKESKVSPTSALGTRPHLHRDLPTSAPRLGVLWGYGALCGCWRRVGLQSMACGDLLGAAVGVQEELRAQMDNVSASLRRRKSYLLPAELIVPTNALLPPQFALALVHLAARHCDGMDGRSLDEKVRTSAPGLAHICTRTRANVRRDSRTSAPRLAFVALACRLRS